MKTVKFTKHFFLLTKNGCGIILCGDKFMQIKTAIFDMDGTLIESLFVWEYIWEGIGRIYFDDPKFYPKEEDDKAVRTFSLKDGMAYIYERYDISGTVEELIDAVDKIIDEFYEKEISVKPGAIEFLEYCKQKGVKMCIASASTPKLVECALKRFDMEKYFEAFFSCSVLGKSKDKPDIYLHAAKQMGSKVEETWVFEDSLTAIETSSKIGMKTVAIYDKFNFGHDKMEEIADFYVGKGENLTKMIGLID